MRLILFLKFPAVLVAMLGSTIPISIIGSKFAMAVTPFWAPIRFGKDDASVLASALKLTHYFSSYSWYALWPICGGNSGFC